MTVVSLMLVVLWSGSQPVESRPPDEVQAAVEQWIKQLESPSLAERSRAERELLDLGPKILRWLPPKELLPGPSSREAVPRITIRLQRRFARESAQASRVTLSGRFKRSELLAEISRQTSNRLVLDPELAEEDAEETWTFENSTFWETLAQIGERYGLYPAAAPHAEGLMLSTPAHAPPQAIFQAGVLRAELLSANSQAIAGDDTQKLIRVHAELLLEPRLRPLFVHFKAGDFTASSREGATLEIWNPDARYELPMTGSTRRSRMNWDFVTAADEVPQQMSLRGKVLVQLAADTEQIRFEVLSDDQEILRRRGGVSVRLQPVEFSAAGDDLRSAKIRVTVAYDAGGPAFESHRTWVYHNSAWIEANDRRYPFTEFEALQQADGGVQVEYRFQRLPAGQGLKFVYEAPTLLLDVPFDVEFQQIVVD